MEILSFYVNSKLKITWNQNQYFLTKLKITSNQSPFFYPIFLQIIAYDRRRGGTIVIDKRPSETVTSLIISQADESDSGRYTCDPASSYPQSIQVHVTKGT